MQVAVRDCSLPLDDHQRRYRKAGRPHALQCMHKAMLRDSLSWLTSPAFLAPGSTRARSGNGNVLARWSNRPGRRAMQDAACARPSAQLDQFKAHEAGVAWTKPWFLLARSRALFSASW